MKNIDKTALQELLDWCDSFDNLPIKPTLTNMKEKIWQLLPIQEHNLDTNQ